MPTARELVSLLLSQDGDRYIFGHEVKAADSNPTAFDCSELVQWGCDRLKVSPVMPDGTWHQITHGRIHNAIVSIEEAVRTQGALLFSFSSSPFTGKRPKAAHVAVSQGNGKTIEARSSKYGVGQFSAVARGWTHAALIPGLTYSTQSPPPPAQGGDTMPWGKPGDPVDTLDDAKKVFEYFGPSVVSAADFTYDENNPALLDERIKVLLARVVDHIMRLNARLLAEEAEGGGPGGISAEDAGDIARAIIADSKIIPS